MVNYYWPILENAVRHYKLIAFRGSIKTILIDMIERIKVNGA